MKIHHIRNATFIIESRGKYILVDPMLGEKGSQLPFTLFRFRPRKNPLVELPSNAWDIINKTTHCILTHRHPDHIDEDGLEFLISKNIPVTVGQFDGDYFRGKGLNVVDTIMYWEEKTFLDGTITSTPARHGNGFITPAMGEVSGFFINLIDEPSIYISADTVYTDDVERVLTEFKPDLSVVASGSAQLDLGKPILMTFPEIVRFVSKAPGKVYANHLETLNHCPTTRIQLKAKIVQEGNTEKVFVPDDGDSFELLI